MCKVILVYNGLSNNCHKTADLIITKNRDEANTLTQHVKDFIFLRSNQHSYYCIKLFSTYSWGPICRGRLIGRYSVVNFENSVISPYIVIINEKGQGLSLLLQQIRLSCLRLIFKFLK